MKVISTVLVSKFQGNCVPVKVRLSPPSKFNEVMGVIELTVQVIVSGVRDRLLLTVP